jgi:hypothetical protein
LPGFMPGILCMAADDSFFVMAGLVPAIHALLE